MICLTLCISPFFLFLFFLTHCFRQTLSFPFVLNNNHVIFFHTNYSKKSLYLRLLLFLHTASFSVDPSVSLSAFVSGAPRRFASWSQKPALAKYVHILNEYSRKVTLRRRWVEPSKYLTFNQSVRIVNKTNLNILLSFFITCHSAVIH